jgi:saposin
MLLLLLAAARSAAARPRAAPVPKARFRQSGSPNTLACEVCKQIIEYIEQLLIAGVIEADIEALVDQACDALPAPLSSLCVAFVNQNIDAIIQWINAGIDSLDICKQLGLCESGPRAGLPCDICREIIGRVIQLVLEGQTEQQIIAGVNAMCDEFAGPLAEFCKSFMDASIDQIIKYCEQGLDATQICTALGLCDAAARRGAR